MPKAMPAVLVRAACGTKAPACAQMGRRRHIRPSVQSTPGHGENAAPHTLFDHFAAPSPLVRNTRFSDGSELPRRARAAPHRPTHEMH